MRQREAELQKGSKGYPKGVIETGTGTPSSTKHGSATNLTAARRCNATLEPSTTQRRRRALQIAAYEAKLAGGMDDGPLGWSGDSLSAQARPGVALHYHAPSLPHPCVPQAGLHTFAGTANEDWAAEEGEHER